ncbi:glycoside hydrolase family 43 protein [Paenibacillus sp. LHD-117]|uniref:glycoside hydrolase family 43 protein n=1 Tax=Paenibacillus sp. LHD-117 TaxID=3071412 RepID=UPI0027DFA983|nr:glycoside hydrolase family 43 protein [Paenibacillus sp. LHD-117]MDQ6423146.1 glycoside hydrolase family 43 protein [Paenibacillus sp. LHD-117]
MRFTTNKTFRNPIMASGADPWMYRHSDGCYYFMVTCGDRLDLHRSPSMSGVALSPKTTIWLPPEEGPGSRDLWAPEIHFIQGKWYVYFTASDGSGDAGRKIYVLENESDDPTKGIWTEKGAVNVALPGLDGTVLEHGGNLYFMYAGYGHFPDYGSAIYASLMENPWTLTGPEVLLTKPEYEWEKQGGMAINEGPCFLVRNGKVFLIYSASTTWSDDYSLGMLVADEGSDLLDPKSWTKSERPVFAKCTETGIYAPGHNSFTQSPDGLEDWIVYHAIPKSEGGMELRQPRMQKFSWTAEGYPDFGKPVPSDTECPVPSGE